LAGADWERLIGVTEVAERVRDKGFALHLPHCRQHPLVSYSAQSDLLFYHPLALGGEIPSAGRRRLAMRERNQRSQRHPPQPECHGAKSS
jgi:hypothetical protein